jgi:hypothetical protein
MKIRGFNRVEIWLWCWIRYEYVLCLGYVMALIVCSLNLGVGSPGIRYLPVRQEPSEYG